MLPIVPNLQEYQYAVEIVNDKMNGAIDINAMCLAIDRKTKEGWRLVTVFTNELGKNAVSVGGIGLNSTVDQTILIFEKKIIVENLLDKEIKKDVPVTTSNIVSPFVPKQITFIMKGTEVSAILKLFCKSDYEIKGLQCDLEVYNIFGDKIVLEDVCFFSFNKDSNGYYVSETFPVKLPEKVGRGLDSVGIIITRYIDSKGLQVSNQRELIDIAQTQKESTNGFDVNVFLNQISDLKSAREILEYMQNLSIDYPNVFSNELMADITKSRNYEKMYGNMKDSAIKKLVAYFDKTL